MRSPLARTSIVAFVVAAATALILPAAPASAHSALISSDPEDGAVLDTPPTEVVLTFNEDILEMGTSIEVTGPDGAEAGEGDPVLNGPEVTQPLAADLAAGEYTMIWRVVSADGHPIDGELTFTATAGTGEEPAEGGAGESEPENTADAEEAAATDDEPTNETAPTGADSDPSGEQPAADDDAGEDAADNDAAGEADDGPGAGRIALFVVAALAVIGGVAALLVRFRRQA
ncbi:copper resistance protein CopC [Ruania alkalisoli]|uniref:Copper resistance protein CopC n=1 Tax=Ruania alkalisoli TaxID=2779775 RepID=A0A7M1SUQ8_9MICO|nr:copper resistance CopC family protein [Ruania alkalisoli]QOR71316.1 copper resistance protein CopC [Ruania alkalisoli]